MKKCSKCNTEKQLDCFYKSSKMKDGHQSSCKQCNDDMTKASRAAKPDQYRLKRQSLRHENMERFNAWKAEQVCTKCGEDTPCCLDLHHLDPSEKEAAIGDVAYSWSWDKLQTELQKCIVVCRNCHAKIHAGLISQ